MKFWFKVCDFNEIEFTEKGVCRIEFKLLGFRFKLLEYNIRPFVR